MRKRDKGQYRPDLLRTFNLFIGRGTKEISFLPKESIGLSSGRSL